MHDRKVTTFVLYQGQTTLKSMWICHHKGTRLPRKCMTTYNISFVLQAICLVEWGFVPCHISYRFHCGFEQTVCPSQRAKACTVFSADLCPWQGSSRVLSCSSSLPMAEPLLRETCRKKLPACIRSAVVLRVCQ